MFFKLLSLFVGVPILEIAILVRLGEAFGFWSTMALVVATGIAGASLARLQGFMVWSRIQQELQYGNMPAEELMDGLLVLIGGVLLLTPGLLTDLFGFSLLIPWTRLFVKRWLRTKFRRMTERREVRFTSFLEGESSYREK